MTTLLDEAADLQWLRETHLKHCRRLPKFTVAELHGHESAPNRIILYEVNHVNSLTMELKSDDNGDFQCDSDKY